MIVMLVEFGCGDLLLLVNFCCLANLVIRINLSNLRLTEIQFDKTDKSPTLFMIALLYSICN